MDNMLNVALPKGRLGEKVYDFDPTDYYVDSNAELVMGLLYDPLFRVNEKGKIKIKKI